MRRIRMVVSTSLFLALASGSPLALSGCTGKDVGEGGVKVGGAQVDPDVVARDKAAADYHADKPAPSK
jgi:hypothetical protein